MIMINLFGLSEVVVRFPSGIFGILTVVLVYAITYDFFKNKKSAFVGGLILLSTPLFISSMRYGMTDTMVTFFITLAIFAAYKGIYDNPKWLRVLGITAGCAIMTKSIIGIIPLIIFSTLLLYTRKNNVVTKLEIFYGAILLVVTVVPWHLFMSFMFGVKFWQDYLGYHVIDRFAQNIIASPYDNYIDATIERLGIWSVIFFVLLVNVRNFVKNYKKGVVVFFFSAVMIIVFFSFAKTVSPHYILPVVPLIVILIGGFIGIIFEKQERLAIVLASISLLNFMPLFILLASDFGESNILIPRIINHFLLISCGLSILISLVFLSSSLFFYKKHKKIIITGSFYVLILMNIFIPFYPDRSPHMKDVGKFISSMDDLSLTHVFMSNSDRHLTNTLLFYLPLGITAERIRMPSDVLFEKNKNHSLCITLHNEPILYNLGEVLYSFPDGELRYCSE